MKLLNCRRYAFFFYFNILAILSMLRSNINHNGRRGRMSFSPSYLKLKRFDWHLEWQFIVKRDILLVIMCPPPSPRGELRWDQSVGARSGRLSTHQPVVSPFTDTLLSASKGLPVSHICNGFPMTAWLWKWPAQSGFVPCNRLRRGSVW